MSKAEMEAQEDVVEKLVQALGGKEKAASIARGNDAQSFVQGLMGTMNDLGPEKKKDGLSSLLAFFSGNVDSPSSPGETPNVPSTDGLER
jgi:hypothetical protein